MFEPRIAMDRGPEAGRVSTPTLSVVLGLARPSATTRIRAALEHDGFVVAEAHNLGEAVEATIRLRPHCCLLDLGLAGDWVAAIDQIRSSVPETKIAVLAASLSELELFRTIREGADGYVLRGPSEDDIAPVVRTLVTGEPGSVPEPTRSARPEAAQPVPAQPRRGLDSRILYGPRFVRHFYRRIHSRMPVAEAWHSTRRRMLDYH
jgi:DNA-binding NarL/FixJ family response regulator